LGHRWGKACWLTSFRCVVVVGGTAPRGKDPPGRRPGPTQSAAGGVAERTRLDFRRAVADTVRMGVSAAVVGFCGGLNRGTIAGESDEYLVARLRAGDDAAF